MPNTQSPSNQTALAVTSINLPSLANIQEMREIIHDNMEGMPFQFPRVKVPSGGGLAWQIPTEDGRPKIAEEIVGVILDHYSCNAYWSKIFEGQNNPPDCSSLDGITGTAAVTATYPGLTKPLEWAGKVRDCATCPLNQWGSDVKGGKGKACKNMRRLYPLLDNEVFPILITLPPTSLGNVKEYMQRLTSKMRPHYGVVTKLTLVEEKNNDGIKFSKVFLSKVEDLTPEQTRSMKQYAEAIKPLARAVAIDATEYADDPAAGGTQTTSTSSLGAGASAGTMWE